MVGLLNTLTVVICHSYVHTKGLHEVQEQNEISVILIEKLDKHVC